MKTGTSGEMLEMPVPRYRPSAGMVHVARGVRWPGRVDGDQPPSKPQYNLSLECFEADDGRIIAPSAPMMSPGRPTPAKDSETTFPDDRQQPEGNVEVILTQTPSPYQEYRFNVPGLGWGINGTWKYVWDYRGLSN